MEALGEKLRQCREAKGYSLDQVARDTHITRRFIEALEEENFPAIPGESYTLGFLRSYSEFLELNPDEIVSLYKNIKLQEQPAPMQELLVKHGLSTATKVGIGVGAALVLAVVGILIYTTGKQDESKLAQSRQAPSDEKLVAFDAMSLERDFKDGDIIRLPLGDKNIDMAIGHKGDKATINLNGNVLELAAGKEWPIDVNQDGSIDMRMTINGVDSRAKPTKIAIKLDRVLAPGATLPPIGGTPPSTIGAANFPPAGSPKLSNRVRQPITVTEAASVGPIAAQLVFSQPVLFRYLNDQGQREERMATANEVMNVSGTAAIRLMVADGSRALLRLNGKDFPMGGEGEVATWQLAWTTGANGQNTLQLQPLY